MKDKILLRNIILYAHLGVKEEEREVRQKISLDVELSLNLEETAQKDDLEKTVDYEKVYNLIKKRIEAKKYHLLEALAQDLAQEILKNFKIEEVLLQAKKLQVKLAGPLDYVAVEVKRKRTNFAVGS
ncbi:dihydroneopterin aldolase [bacterium]|nr:dihydroneopterin aldolase [bacterium]MCG2677003.1 dihydroneopterin aldolase [bacterium]